MEDKTPQPQRGIPEGRLKGKVLRVRLSAFHWHWLERLWGKGRMSEGIRELLEREIVRVSRKGKE